MLVSFLLYGTTYSISLLSCAWYQKSLKRQKKIRGIFCMKVLFFYLIIMGLPVLLAGFRYGVGKDYFNYADFFQWFCKASLKETIESYLEIGYALLNKLCGLLTHNQIIIFAVTSFLLLYLVIKTLEYYQNQGSMVLGLFIFFMVIFQSSLNAVRNQIAACIILYSYRYLIEKKFWKYTLLVLAAGAFHKSAVVCLVFYLIHVIRKRQVFRVFFYVLITLSPVVMYVFAYIIRFVCMRLNIYTTYMDKAIGKPSYGFLLYILPVLCCILFFCKSLYQKKPEYKLYVMLFCLQIPFQCLGNYISYGDRLALYSSCVQVILVPALVKSIQNRNNRMVITGALCFWYLFFYVIVNIVMNGNGTYPYVFIWQR